MRPQWDRPWDGLTMRRLPPLSEFLAIIAERRRALRIDDEVYARARNSGRRRIAEKRELLRRINRRARKAGVKPFEANFQGRPPMQRPQGLH
jgi:hypothetical protein